MSGAYTLETRRETPHMQTCEIRIKQELDCGENNEVPGLSDVRIYDKHTVKEEPELNIWDEFTESGPDTPPKIKRTKNPAAETEILIENHLERCHTDQSQKRRKHSNKKDKKCSVCSNTFYSNRDMEQHLIAVHMKEKRYECELCGLKHSSYNNLSRHLKRHEKKFCCAKCFKFTFTKVELEKHMQSHITKKVDETFECNICHIQIKRIDCLRRHIQTVHKKIKFYCNFCDKYYCYKKSLAYHLSQVHSIK